jgi:hypothetical protein
MKPVAVALCAGRLLAVTRLATAVVLAGTRGSR